MHQLWTKSGSQKENNRATLTNKTSTGVTKSNLLSFHLDERALIPAAWLSPRSNKARGAQGNSRSALPQPSASWACIGASVLWSSPRAPGPPGDLFVKFTYVWLRLPWAYQENTKFHNIEWAVRNIRCNISHFRSASPCLSSRSSPILAAPRTPCLEGSSEPFSEGAEVQVGNLDYRMSRKDLQQTLHDTFSRYGRVIPIPCIFLFDSLKEKK